MNIDTLRKNMNNQLDILLKSIKQLNSNMEKLKMLLNRSVERIEQLEETVKNLPEDMDTKI